jgi:hypothetical protein
MTPGNTRVERRVLNHQILRHPGAPTKGTFFFIGWPFFPEPENPSFNRPLTASRPQNLRFIDTQKLGRQFVNLAIICRDFERYLS